MIKDDLRKFTLPLLQDVLEQCDEDRIGACVSHHMAVARIWSNDLARHFKSQPFFMDEWRFLMLQKGHVDVRVNMVKYSIEPGTLCFVGRSVVTEIMNTSDDLQGFVLSLSDEMLHLALGNNIPSAFDGHLHAFFLPLPLSEVDFLDNLHHIIYDVFKQETSSWPVLLQLSGAFLMHIAYLWDKNGQPQAAPRSRNQQIFSDFIRLVSQHASQQHTLEFYASQLCITPRYMGSVISNVSGKSAKCWIDEAIVNAIKVQLRYSNQQVTEIANSMDFPNPSFFCKYFKRLTGMTPLEYREKRS